MMMERIFAMVMNMPMMITIASLLVNPFNYGELPDEHLLMFDLNYLISIPPKKFQIFKTLTSLMRIQV